MPIAFPIMRLSLARSPSALCFVPWYICCLDIIGTASIGYLLLLCASASGLTALHCFLVATAAELFLSAS